MPQLEGVEMTTVLATIGTGLAFLLAVFLILGATLEDVGAAL